MLKRNKPTHNYFFILLLSILVFLLLNSQSIIAYGQEIPTPAQQNGNELGDKVKEIRDAVKEKVREKIDEVKKGQKKAFVGEITTINEIVISLETHNGSSQIQIAADAILLGISRNQIDAEDLATGDFVIAMGFLDENSVLQTSRLLVIEKPEPISRQAVFGIVSDISQTGNVLTVKNPKTGAIYTVEADNKTTITKKIDNEMAETDFDLIEVDDRLVAVGDSEENSEIIIAAKLIHVIPGLSEGQKTPQEEAAGEAQPTGEETIVETPAKAPAKTASPTPIE